MAEKLTLRRPDDWHVHVRDGAMLKSVLPHTAKYFGRAIIMPNLIPPVVSYQDAVSYRDRIRAVIPSENSAFEPLMTLYLTEGSDPVNLREGFEKGIVSAAKLYPAGATTNSDAGVRDIEKIYPVLETMEEIDMPLLVHGEVVDPAIDIFDREAVFIERALAALVERFPRLRIVFEHVTTEDGVKFVNSAPDNIAATITPHHLVINRNAMLVGGIQPHYYCLPVAKRESHRAALVAAATSGDKKFFLGTDSAPHTLAAKQSECGCAGIFNVTVAMSVLAHIFESASALDKLEAFCSLNGPAFYQMKPNDELMTLIKLDEPVKFDDHITVSHDKIRVFDPMFELYWALDG